MGRLIVPATQRICYFFFLFWDWNICVLTLQCQIHNQNLEYYDNRILLTLDFPKCPKYFTALCYYFHIRQNQNRDTEELNLLIFSILYFKYGSFLTKQIHLFLINYLHFLL